MLPTPISDLELHAAERAYVDHVTKLFINLYEGLQHADNDSARGAVLRRATTSLAKAREIRQLAKDILRSI
jgi:hypothetical protein